MVNNGIVIKDKNKVKIEEIIKEVEGRASVRCITYDKIVNVMSEIDLKLSVIPKKYQPGITVNVDINAQHFNDSYKGIPVSTKFEAVKTNSGWKLTDVYRDKCRSCTQKIQMKLTQDAKEALIAAFEN